MKKCLKKETLWKFIAKDSYNSLYLELPGLLKIFKYFLILNLFGYSSYFLE